MPNKSKNKNKCTKCGDKHYPPTGKKCVLYIGTNQDSEDNDILGSSTVPVGTSGSRSKVGSSTVPVGPSGSGNSFVKHKSPLKMVGLSSDEEDTVSLQILKQLQKVNDRLDIVEEKVDGATTSSRRGQQQIQRKHKLSRHCDNKSSKKQYKQTWSDSSDSSESSESDSDVIDNIPKPSGLRGSVKMQRKVDERIRRLEAIHDSPGTKLSQKIKSKRGGNVEVLVKRKVAWPHESVLGGVSKTRMSYDQLTMAQWVMGFTRNILDEADLNTRESMLTYMSELMEDVSDFGWQGAKAAHAVLCCEMERGSVEWSDTNRIDRIRRAHAQRHRVESTKTWSKNYQEGGKKPWFCKMFQSGSCTHTKDHELNGKIHRHICAYCSLQGRVLTHPEKDCMFAKRNHGSKNE